jgi:predicted  nucleic acid-binding Zn-ribbon protein|tara:strand:- start:152 stop:424 length:273 start_codon:yes stop_codon:yes gene_type:complete
MKKVKSIKAEEAKVQVTEEQLKTIKGQQEELGGLLRDIGYLETQKHALNHKYANVVKDMEDFKAELEKEYGAVNISLEDGTCTPIEKESE